MQTPEEFVLPTAGKGSHVWSRLKTACREDPLKGTFSRRTQSIPARRQRRHLGTVWSPGLETVSFSQPQSIWLIITYIAGVCFDNSGLLTVSLSFWECAGFTDQANISQ